MERALYIMERALYIMERALYIMERALYIMERAPSEELKALRHVIHTQKNIYV